MSDNKITVATNETRQAWQLLDKVSDLIQIVRNDGCFLFVNRTCQQVLGYTPAEFRSLNIWDVVQPARHARLNAALKEVTADHSPELEIPFVTRSGKTVMLSGCLNLEMTVPDQISPAYAFVFKTSQTSFTALTPNFLSQPNDGIKNATHSLSHFLSPDNFKKEETVWQGDFAGQLLGAMGQGLIVSDTSGLISFVNPAFSRIINYPIDEILGRKLDDFQVLDDSAIANSQETENAVQRGENFTCEANLLEGGGSTVYALITSTPYYHEAARVGTISVISNLTKRKEVELELERERQFVTTTLETAGSLIIVLDEKGAVVRWNRASTVLTGWSAEEATGKLVWDLIYPAEARVESEKGYALLIKSQQPLTFENDVLIRSGEALKVSWSTTQILDANGETKFLVGIGIDVTAQRKTENALRENERHYRSLTEAAFEGIFLSEGNFMIDANQAGTEIFGYSLAEFRNMRPVDLIAPEDRPIVAANRSAGFNNTYEVRGQRKDGSYFPLEVRGKTEFDQRRQIPIRVTAVRDLTAHKEAEEKQARLVKQLQSTVVRMQALYDSTMALVGSAALSDVLQTVADGAVRALAAHRVSVILIDRKAEKVLGTYKSGSGAELVEEVSYGELTEGLTGWVLENREVALSSKEGPDPRESPLVQQRRADTDCGAIMVAPLLYREQLLGTITAINTPDGPDFSAPDLELLTVLAGQASTAINSAQLLAETRHQAQTDSLTGLQNRRAFFGKGEALVKEAYLDGRDAAVILIDADHFKRVNDFYGHSSGDEALRVISNCCLEVGGKEALVGRYGGEEFALLLPGHDKEKARQVAERLRVKIAETPVIITSSEATLNIQVTVSLGVDTLSGKEESLEKLVARADKALYRAKNSGRNRVEVAGEAE